MKPKFNITLRHEFKSLDRFVTEVAQHGLPADVTEVYRSRNRIVWCAREGYKINIKAFKLPNKLNEFVYATLRKSKAERSYLNALQLRALGFATPVPVAFVEERYPARLGRSYYFSLQEEGSELRHMEDRTDRLPILTALGAEMHRLHSAGIWMKDFSPGNVLMTHAGDGEYRFKYVDLNRIEWNCHSRHKLMKMFGAIVYTPEHLRMITDGYAAARGCDPEALFAEALLYMEAFEKKKARKKRLKKLLKRDKKRKPII